MLDVNVVSKFEKIRGKSEKMPNEFLLNCVVNVRFKKRNQLFAIQNSEYTSLDFLQKKFHFQHMPSVLAKRARTTIQKTKNYRSPTTSNDQKQAGFLEQPNRKRYYSDLIDDFDVDNIEEIN